MIDSCALFLKGSGRYSILRGMVTSPLQSFIIVGVSEHKTNLFIGAFQATRHSCFHNLLPVRAPNP